MLADGEPTSRREPPESAGYFAPTPGGTAYRSFGGQVTWARLALRIALAFALLLGVDVVVARTLTPAAVYEHDYRLPRTLPTASLAGFADSVHAASLSQSGGPVVAFVGSSPTWGHRIKDPANAYPAAFGAAGGAAGWPNRTYNFASNGQFLADEYFVAKAVSADADAVFVQLTYHTFDSRARDGAPLRYPEIPQLLRLDVTPDEAGLLGIEQSAAAKVTSRADALLGRYWLLWRERDALDRRLFGGRPQDLLGGRTAEESRLTSLPVDDDDGAEFASFEELDDVKRMVVIARYSENSSFRIDPADSEVRFLRELVALLAARNKKAVFFMAPLNRQLIKDYELIDPEQYAENVGLLRDIVTTAGFPFLDYNSGPVELPGTLFADVSHATDEGGKAVGMLLYRDTWRYLGAVEP